MILDITIYGDEVLREKAKPVEKIDDGIKDLVYDMLETMHDADGVGLAAQQVGRTEDICVIDVPAESEKAKYREFNSAVEMPLVLINAKITATEGTQRDMEGCLSFPDIHAQITRADKVSVEYTNLDGERREATACGLLARAIQHELDHLQGTLMVDRMSKLQQMSAAGKLKRLRTER